MFKNIDNRLNYAEMYNWTNDLPSGSIDTFLSVIKYFNVTHIDKPKKILEIGTFVGTSCIKLLELIPNSEATVIDKWENYVEGDVNILDNIEENNIEKIFYSNIKNACLTDRFTVFKGDSSSVLLDLIKNGKKFNFIYVDGCHTLLESYTDLLLSLKF